MTVPPAPQFGEPIFGQASPEVLAFLARRRSASAMTLTAPGPSAAQREELLRLAARVPDHGKLNPWRFLIIEGAAKADLVARLEVMARDKPNAPKAMASLAKLRNPPLAVAVIASPVEGQIPLWEQHMSAAAVCSTLLNAATAMGFGANWITDWYAYDRACTELLGLGQGERVAGFLYIGTETEAPLERVRPDIAALTSVWSPPA